MGALKNNVTKSNGLGVGKDIEIVASDSSDKGDLNCDILVLLKSAEFGRV